MTGISSHPNLILTLNPNPDPNPNPNRYPNPSQVVIDVAFKQFLVMPEWMEVRARARDRARVGARFRVRGSV